MCLNSSVSSVAQSNHSGCGFEFQRKQYGNFGYGYFLNNTKSYRTFIIINFLFFPKGAALHHRAHRGQPAAEGDPHHGRAARRVPPEVRGIRQHRGLRY